MARSSSSGGVRIRLPFFLQFVLVGQPSPKKETVKGHQLLGDLITGGLSDHFCDPWVWVRIKPPGCLWISQKSFFRAVGSGICDTRARAEPQRLPPKKGGDATSGCGSKLCTQEGALVNANTGISQKEESQESNTPFEPFEQQIPHLSVRHLVLKPGCLKARKKKHGKATRPKTP